MASYKFPIKIQKLNEESEIWEDCYFSEEKKKSNNPIIHANINKTGGREYVNASSNISASTFDFKIRYFKGAEDIIYNTEIYRIIYDNRIFKIENVDRYAENKSEITLIGSYNGANN